MLCNFKTEEAQNLVREALHYNIDYYRGRDEGAFMNDNFVVQKHICEFDMAEVRLFRHLTLPYTAFCLLIIRQQFTGSNLRRKCQDLVTPRLEAYRVENRVFRRRKIVSE